MKKIILNIVLAVLCLNFAAQAQDKTPNITALKIGDKVPDITINNILNYKDVTGKPATSAKISDFKGKLLILDFWATWCSPCVAMIPKMDSLQKEFDGKVQFLPVAYQSEQIITQFLEKFQQQKRKLYNLPDVTNDTGLSKLFPHQTLPHYVWIDSKGALLANTGFEEISENNISQIISEQSVNFLEKKDALPITYNKAEPLLVGNNGGDGKNILCHSLLTKFTSGLFAGYDYFNEDTVNKQRIVARNLPLFWLYKLAYGNEEYLGDNRIAVTVKESDKINSKLIGTAYENWMKQGNVFCYELITPSKDPAIAFKWMQEDLKRFFPQYIASLKKTKMQCYALVRTSKVDKIHTKGGQSQTHFDPFGCQLINFPLNRLIAQLNVVYLQKSSTPIIDDTGYTDFVDLDIKAPLSNIGAINKELANYDLQFILKDEYINKLFIEDSPLNFGQLK